MTPALTRRITPLVPRPYLEETTTVRVRFNEVDALGVVWHGHYVNYLEEGRRAFGRRYGIDYAVFFAHDLFAPVVQLRVDFLAPAQMCDRLEVTARLFQSDAVKLEFEYEIHRLEERILLARGGTVQVFTSRAGGLLLVWPAFMLERFEAWKDLWIQPPAAV